MPVEAVAVSFESTGKESVLKAAEAVNAALSRGTYIGHIAVTSGDTNRYSPSPHVEGVVLLIETPDPKEEPEEWPKEREEKTGQSLSLA